MSRRHSVPPVGPGCLGRRHDDQGEPPRVLPGLEICVDCRDLAERGLVELPELYELCAYVLDLHRPPRQERVSGHRPNGITLRDSVVAVRCDIQTVLASWCGLVANERGVLGPDGLGVRQLVGFLAIHLNWLTGHPAAPDLADELADLVAVAENVLRPPAEPRRELGYCPYPGCDSILVAARDPEQGTERVRCEVGHVWAPEQWLLLRSHTGDHEKRPKSRESME